MKLLKKLSLMYTIFNLALVAAIIAGNAASWLLHFAQANSLLIVYGVLSAYIICGPSEVWGVYDSYVKLFDKKELYIIVDVVTHILPVLIVGLPSTQLAWMFIPAYACLATWYILVRDRIHELYMRIPKNKYDMIVFVYIPLMVLLGILLPCL